MPAWRLRLPLPLPLLLLVVVVCIALPVAPATAQPAGDDTDIPPPPSAAPAGPAASDATGATGATGNPGGSFVGIDITIEDPDGKWESHEDVVADLEQPERRRRCRVFVVPHRFSIVHSSPGVGNLRLSGDRLVIWQGLQSAVQADDPGSRLLEFYAAGNVRLEWERISVPLAGKSFAFAGDLGELTLTTAASRVTNLGGTIQREIGSQPLDFLVAGLDTPSAVKEAASRAGAEILDVAQFRRKLNEAPRSEASLPQPSQMMRADEVFISLTNGIRGLITNVRARAQLPNGANWYIAARELRILSVRDAIGEDARLSITPFALPWLHIRAKRIRWRQRENERGSVRVINVQGAELWDGPIRVSPIPDLDQNLDRSSFIRGLAFNQSDRFGFSILTDIDFGLLVHDNILGKTFDDTSITGRIVGGVNFHTERGVAPWLQLSWGRTGDRHTGFVDGGIYAWYIHDSGDNTQFGIDNGYFPLSNADRLRLRLWHQQEFPLGLALHLQLSYFSDQNLLQEFFRSEFDAQSNQDTYIELTRYDSRTGVRALWQRQVNKHDETIEYQPRVEFFLYPSRLFDLPLINVPVYLHVQADIARPKFRPASGSNEASYVSTRLNLRPGLTLPIDFGFVGFYQKAFVDLSWYGWELDTSDITLPHRVYAEGQSGLFTNIFRTFAGHSSLFDIEGVRHVIRPEVVFVHRFPVTYLLGRTSADIPQFDEIDEPVAGVDRVDFILSTRLEGLRRSGSAYRVVDILSARAELSWYPNANRDNSGDSFGPLFASFSFAPRPWFTLSGDLRMSPSTGIISRYGVAAELVIELPWGGVSIDSGFPDPRASGRPLLRFQLSHRIVRNTSTISSFSAAWRASPVYAMQFYAEYDFRSQVVRNLNVSVQRTFQEFVLTFSVRRDFIRDDTSLLITFAPFVLGESTDVVTAGLDPTYARSGVR